MRNEAISKINLPDKKDIAHATSVYPAIVANPVFRQLHNELMTTLGAHLEDDGSRILLVLGLSPIASPYGDNRQWVEAYFGKKGKIISIDYNIKVLAEAFMYLNEKGFFEFMKPKIYVSSKRSYDALMNNGLGAYFSANSLPKDIIEIMHGVIDPGKTEERSWILAEGNLKDGISIKDSSVSAVDSTLTLHHVAAFDRQIRFILGEIKRVMMPGAIFHWGDALIDTRHSERKIIMMMDDLAEILGEDLLMVDRRDIERVLTAKFGKGRRHAEAEIHSIHDFFDPFLRKIEITDRGYVQFEHGEDNGEDKKDIIRKMKEKGYVEVLAEKGMIRLPIIDVDMDCDKDFIRTVNEFYELNREAKKNLKNLPIMMIQKSLEAGDDERMNALKGLFEYWSDDRTMVKLLKDAGFSDVHVEYTSRRYNLRPDVGAVIAKRP